MMSHPFSINSQRCVPSQDFIMMNNNNNYLPGVFRGTDSLRVPRPPLVTDTPDSQVHNLTAGLNCHSELDTGRFSANMADCGSTGCQVNMADSERYIAGSGVVVSPLAGISGSAVEVDMKPSHLCEHQGSTSAQTSNISQNSGWTNAYYTGSQNLNCTNNFTFTTPTQSYLYSPALTATTQNRFQNVRLRPQTFAPGCNAQWQHAVPRRMPWLRQGSVSCPQGLSVFTGSQSSSVCSVSQSEHLATGTSTFYSPQMNQPVASCSELIRRPKRRHTVDVVEDGCPRSKIHLTEEKIASHMKDLRIHSCSPPPLSTIPTGKQYLDTGQGGMDPLLDTGQGVVNMQSDTGQGVVNMQSDTGQGVVNMQSDTGQGVVNMQSDTGQGVVNMQSDTGQGGSDHLSDTCYPGQTQQNGCNTEFLRHSQRQWHDFKLLEEKLEMIDEDSSSENEDSSKPVLRIVDGIEVTPKPVLPQDILDKIRNPCQQVVLWSPQIIPGKKDDDSDEETETNPEFGDMMEASVPGSESSCQEIGVELEDSGMETDPEDDSL